jgi:hypothetical protein
MTPNWTRHFSRIIRETERRLAERKQQGGDRRE